jgi:hypothetical protein
VDIAENLISRDSLIDSNTCRKGTDVKNLMTLALAILTVLILSTTASSKIRSTTETCTIGEPGLECRVIKTDSNYKADGAGDWLRPNHAYQFRSTGKKHCTIKVDKKQSRFKNCKATYSSTYINSQGDWSEPGIVVEVIKPEAWDYDLTYDLLCKEPPPPKEKKKPAEQDAGAKAKAGKDAKTKADKDAKTKTAGMSDTAKTDQTAKAKPTDKELQAKAKADADAKIKTEAGARAKAEAEARTKAETKPPAPEPPKDRFIAYGNGTVLDTRTRLMWAATDNGSSIDWSGAKSYCESYRGGGYGDWRMPTQNELRSLSYLDGNVKGKHYATTCGERVIAPQSILLTCSYHWASDTRGSERGCFLFVGPFAGGPCWISKASTELFRALPVRNAK